jgi:signal transduction histidine kinase
MTMRRLFCVLWAWALLQCCAATAAPPQALHLTQAQVLQVPDLDDAPPPRVVDVDALPGTWQRVALPFAQRQDIAGQAAGALTHHDRQVVTWYRIAVPASEWSRVPLMLYGARAKAYGPISVYVNGQLIGQWQLNEVGWYWAPFLLTVDNGERSTNPHEIVVRMAHKAHTRTALSSLWLGPHEAIHWRYQVREWGQMQFPAMGGGAFLAIGIFAFFVWLLGERDRVYLLFAVLGVSSFIRGLHYYTSFSIDNAWLAWLTVNSLFWLIATIHHLQMYLHGTRMPRLSWTINGIVAVVFVLTLPAVGGIPNTPDFTPLIYVLAMLTSPLVALAGFQLSWRKSSDGMLLASIVAVGTLFGFNDWAIQNNLLGPESWYLGPNANIINFAGFCYLIFRYYMRAVLEAKQAHQDLAQRLTDKEAELRDSYDRLREVERAQTLFDERRRLTQDMHDGLGSSLNSALRAVERGRANGQDVAEILRTCIDDLHLAIDSMEPEHADLLLLLATLRHRLGPRLQLAGVTLHWQVNDVPAMPWLDPRISLHILRILQEALTNSLKHSGANQLWLSTVTAGEVVKVIIRDNGAGYDVDQAVSRGGRGMRNQLRRASAIGAEILWSSSSQGSQTELTLPLNTPYPS